MAGIARILPRDWDGRRLLRFLAGLALIALSFAVHLGAAVDPPDARATGPAVDAPAVGSDRTDPPRVAEPTDGQAPPEARAVADRAVADRAVADRAVGPVAPAWMADAAPGTVLPAAVGAHGASRVALPAGVAPGALGSRAPPRR